MLGVPVSAGSLDDVVRQVASWIIADRPSFAIFRDVHGIMRSQHNAQVMAAHQSAGLVACDGMPMVWASRWAGVRGAERVCGRDFMFALCERAEREGWSAFFYGGRPGVPESLIHQLLARFPKLKIAGAYSPPFRALTPAEDAEVSEMIKASRADIVWVGLSTPKQELWMAEHVGRVGAPALLGVGAAFDFHAGEIRHAPVWIQRVGLEWLFRLAMEPRRLGGRYLRNNPAFIAAILRRHPRRLGGGAPTLQAMQ